MPKLTRKEFEKLSLKERIKKMRGSKEERTFSFERDGIDEEARTVWLSISSEEPYERWWGIEVLDHSKASVKIERLEAGIPLLMDHNSHDQIAIVDEYAIAKDKKLRLKARFSKSARAEEIFQDVIEGIRKNTSVGYMINNMILVETKDDVSTYRVTDWTPYEGSIVAIPADQTVGVGRSKEIEQEDFTMPDPIKEKEKVKPVISDAEIEAIKQRELQRINEVTMLGREFANFGGVELAQEYVKDTKHSLAEFKAALLAKVSEKQKVLATAQPAEVQRTQRIQMHYRHKPLVAFRDIPLAGGGVMKGEEAAFRAGQWLLATVYKNETAQRYCKEHGINLSVKGSIDASRVMGSSTLTGGGAIVPDEMEAGIIDLRDAYGVARRLARVRPMSSSSQTIPKRTGGLTAYHFQDEDGNGITASDKSWGEVQLNAKKLGCLAKISQDMVEDAIIDTVDDLAQEMAYAFAVQEDTEFLNGDGTSSHAGIQGIITLLEATAYVGRTSITAGNDTFQEIDAIDLALVMANVAAYGKPGASWLISETGKTLVFDRLAQASGGNTMVDVGGTPRPSYLGYPIVTSEKMPAGATTDYSSKIMLLFGRFDLAASLGSRRGITIQVLYERYAELGQLGIIGTERYDMVVHDLGSTTAKGPLSGAYGN